MEQRKILILTSRFGNGHYSVAEAISEYCSEQGDDVRILDVVEVAYPNLSDTIYKAFNNIVCRNVSLYNFCNSLGRKESKKNVNHRLMKKIKEISPEQIVITWSGCCKMLGNVPIPVTVCITDMGLHSGWVYPAAEKYLVASQDVAQKLCEYGVDRSIIEASGIPVKKAFHHNLKFITSKKKILIMGGGSELFRGLKMFLTA